MWTAAGQLLRSEGRFAAAHARVPLARLFLLTTCGGAVYGAVMGNFAGPLGALYSALKVPLLLVASLVLCLPAFRAVNALLGLGADFPAALRAIASAQGTLAVVLASLAPVTAFFELCGLDHSAAVSWNGAAFLIALAAAQTMLARHYRPLVARDARHRLALIAWFVLQVFVGIKAAWVLRPLVGDPTLPVEFVRAGRWYENPYVHVFWNVADVAWKLGRTLGLVPE